MVLMFKLTLAHEPDIRLGAIALVVGIEDTANTSDHLVRSLEVTVWLLRNGRKIEKSEERRDNEQERNRSSLLSVERLVIGL
jgi:hypothetical protein